MEREKLPAGALAIMMKEHAFLRDEIKDRLKIAFSHVAYAGGIAAFALPVASRVAGDVPTAVSVLAAVVGFGGLLWVAHHNMRWVQHCGERVRQIEARVNLHFGTEVLGWEHYSAVPQQAHWLLIPPEPRRQSQQSGSSPPGSSGGNAGGA